MANPVVGGRHDDGEAPEEVLPTIPVARGAKGQSRESATPAREGGQPVSSGRARAPVPGPATAPQLQDRLRVDLAHAALGDAEHAADLGERESLVVVEREHESLAVGHAVDRVGEEVLHLVDLERLDRIVLAGRRSCRPPSTSRRRSPFPPPPSSSSSATRPVNEICESVWSSSSSDHPELGRDLLVLGAAAQLVLELRVRALDRAGLRAAPSAAPSRSSAARR